MILLFTLSDCLIVLVSIFFAHDMEIGFFSFVASVFIADRQIATSSFFVVSGFEFSSISCYFFPVCCRAREG